MKPLNTIPLIDTFLIQFTCLLVVISTSIYMVRRYKSIGTLNSSRKKEQYLEKRLEKLDVLESSSLAWLASTATKNGFTMESLYGMSHYYYRHCCHAACLASAAAAATAAAAASRYFYLSMLESHQSRPQLMQDHLSLAMDIG